jgi:hypothetical protein
VLTAEDISSLAAVYSMLGGAGAAEVGSGFRGVALDTCCTMTSEFQGAISEMKYLRYCAYRGTKPRIMPFKYTGYMRGAAGKSNIVRGEAT